MEWLRRFIRSLFEKRVDESGDMRIVVRSPLVIYVLVAVCFITMITHLCRLL